MYLEKTTADERITISNAIYAPLYDIERAHRLLCTLWNDYLGSKEDRPKTHDDWEDVEDRVSVIMDIVCNAIFECKLAYADEEAVTQYLETAQQLQAAKAVHDARAQFRPVTGTGACRSRMKLHARRTMPFRFRTIRRFPFCKRS